MKLVRRQCRIEAIALQQTFSYHPENSDMKKFLVFVLLVTWASISVGVAFGAAEATPVYSMLTALVWALIGRIWGGNAKDISSGSDKFR